MNLIQRNKSYLVTIFFELSILVLSFLVYRLASETMTEFGFSEYTLSRRTVSLLQPLLMMGLGVAVPRYISYYPKRESILVTSILLLLFAAIFIFSILLINQNFFAKVFFGDTVYSDYLFPLFLLLLGYCLHALVFGFLRGKHSVYMPNIIQFINIGLLPIAVILFFSTVKEILFVNGSILIFNSLSLALFYKLKNKISLNKKTFYSDSITLLKYGLPRILGDFSLLFLITMPTYLILYIQKDMLVSGDVAYSLTLLNLVGAAFGPLGLILVPEISNYMNKQEYAEIKKRFYNFMFIALGITLIGFVTYWTLSETILKLLLGEDYRENINTVSRLILKASFGYALYIVLRNFLDAIRVKALN